MTLNVQHKLPESMVTEYGMSKKLGPLQFSSSSGGQVFLEKICKASLITLVKLLMKLIKVQRIVKEQYERCKQILLEHEEQLKLIAKTLLTENISCRTNPFII